MSLKKKLFNVFLICFLICLFILISLPSIFLLFSSLSENLSNKKYIKKLMKSKLFGVYYNQKFPIFTTQSFINGKFQQEFSKWFQENYGGREHLIRINNQLYYSLFKKSYQYSDNIIIGKENQLYERGYINDYVNIAPVMSVNDQKRFVAKISKARDLFEQRGIKFIILITPSKAYTYPEYIPDVFLNIKKGGTTYDEIIPLIAANKINLVDSQKLVLEHKKKLSLPVFPRGGIHWTYLEAFYSLQELNKTIEKVTSIRIPEMKMNRIITDQKTIWIDTDLVDLLNLYVTPLDYIAPTPELPVYKVSRGSTIKVSIIGGSFIGLMQGFIEQNWIYGSIHNYYYYTTSFTAFPADEKLKKEFFPREKKWWENQFLKSDIVILEINQASFGLRIQEYFFDDAIKYMSEK